MKIGSFEAGSIRRNEEEKYRSFSEHTSAIELNEHVSFEKIFSKINLYFVAKPGTGIEDEYYKEAMRKLLNFIRSSSNIKTIEANSWFVDEAPFLFKDDGFTVKGKIARISREKFLLLNFKKYFG